MLEIIQSDTAVKDAEDIWFYLAERNRSAADRTIHDISSTIRRLAEYPYLGQDQRDFAAGLRSFSCGMYIVFHRVTKTQLQIARILHASRDVDSIMKESE